VNRLVMTAIVVGLVIAAIFIGVRKYLETMKATTRDDLDRKLIEGARAIGQDGKADELAAAMKDDNETSPKEFGYIFAGAIILALAGGIVGGGPGLLLGGLLGGAGVFARIEYMEQKRRLEAEKAIIYPASQPVTDISGATGTETLGGGKGSVNVPGSY